MQIDISLTGMEGLDDQIAGAVRDSARDLFRDAVKDYRCPEHGTPIESLTIDGGRRLIDDKLDVGVSVKACCDRAVDEALELVAAAR